MLFYDDFVKNINEFNKNEFKDLEIFKLEFKKKLVWLCTGIPTIMISLYFAYVGYLHNYRAINIIFSILLMYMGCKHVFATLKYDIRINNKVGELIYEKMHIPFQEIESCTLRESSVGKKSNYQIVLDIITREKKQYIIPLMMNRKIEFVGNVKYKLQKKFNIIN